MVLSDRRFLPTCLLNRLDSILYCNPRILLLTFTFLVSAFLALLLRFQKQYRFKKKNSFNTRSIKYYHEGLVNMTLRKILEAGQRRLTIND